MVEGHGVHRVALFHRAILLGRRFRATSPNGRFTEGARLIDNQPLTRIEAVGKNLFYFWGGGTRSGGNQIVMHVHFGMAGRFATFSPAKAPEPTPTTRLRLTSLPKEDSSTGADAVVAHLSAMTVQHGGFDLWTRLRANLGEDPLREDADGEAFWRACGHPDSRASSASIGAILMDQKRIAGVGNIYRAEICFKAGVHPEQPAKTLGRERFERVWLHSIDLLRRGVATGSILTVDKADTALPNGAKRRRYVYNQKDCLICGTRVVSWPMAGRTCYACPSCQALDDGIEIPAARRKALATARATKIFNSHCAPEAGQRRGGGRGGAESGTIVPPKMRPMPQIVSKPVTLSQEAATALQAAHEKRAAGEGRNVEHVALEDDASLGLATAPQTPPSQRRKARAAKRRQTAVKDEDGVQLEEAQKMIPKVSTRRAKRRARTSAATASTSSARRKLPTE